MKRNNDEQACRGMPVELAAVRQFADGKSGGKQQRHRFWEQT